MNYLDIIFFFKRFKQFTFWFNWSTFAFLTPLSCQTRSETKITRTSITEDLNLVFFFLSFFFFKFPMLCSGGCGNAQHNCYTHFIWFNFSAVTFWLRKFWWSTQVCVSWKSFLSFSYSYQLWNVVPSDLQTENIEYVVVAKMRVIN